MALILSLHRLRALLESCWFQHLYALDYQRDSEPESQSPDTVPDGDISDTGIDPGSTCDHHKSPNGHDIARRRRPQAQP
jgi:hypothetical protein